MSFVISVDSFPKHTNHCWHFSSLTCKLQFEQKRCFSCTNHVKKHEESHRRMMITGNKGRVIDVTALPALEAL